jgi:glycosyltransferase involved in cell wall biosynthesis
LIQNQQNELLKNSTIIKSVSTNQSVVVIIPFYNGSDFIERSIESVFEQTIPPSEFIIVDDGSKNTERDFLLNLAKKYPFTVIHKENGGQSSARNAGVAASKSEYICFLDQDDFYLPNHIEVLLNAIPQNDSLFGFAYADLYEADGDGNIIRMGMIKEHSHHPKRDISCLLGQDMFVLPSASIICRKAFDGVNGFDPQFMGYEDDDLFLRMFRSGYSNYFIDTPVTVWCIHSESTSYSIRMPRSRWRYFCKLNDLYPDDPIRCRFFFRDLLLPRFAPLFIKDAVEAKILNENFFPELLEILNSFKNKVMQSPFIGYRYKIKLSLLTYCLGLFPAKFIKFIFRYTKYKYLYTNK